MELDSVLSIASTILATITVILSLYRLRRDSRRIKTLTAVLAFVIVFMIIALGMLGSLLSWVLAPAWVFIFVLNLKESDSKTSE